jgi:hypothetical protein
VSQEQFLGKQAAPFPRQPVLEEALSVKPDMVKTFTGVLDLQKKMKTHVKLKAIEFLCLTRIHKWQHQRQ